MRRGDQAKCQWHVIEPVYVLHSSCVYARFNTCSSDKYVSRSEYDELKTRFDRLEAVVERMQGMINAAGPVPGEMPTGSNAAIFAPQLTDRGTYPPAAFNQPIPGPSHRTDPESAYAAVEAYRNPTQSPISSSAYPAPFPLRAQQQRASSPGLQPPSEQGSSPSGYMAGKPVFVYNLRCDPTHAVRSQETFRIRDAVHRTSAWAFSSYGRWVIKYPCPTSAGLHAVASQSAPTRPRRRSVRAPLANGR